MLVPIQRKSCRSHQQCDAKKYAEASPDRYQACKDNSENDARQNHNSVN